MPNSKYKQIPSLRKPDVERFWSHVDKSGNDQSCWLWTGPKNSKGYGRFFAGGRYFYSHRLSWSLADREVPINLILCHTCDNRGCVNPLHLIVADVPTNNRDAKRNLATRKKPSKPHPDFPLSPHRNGQWSKKVKGKRHYFGLWADPGAALAEWNEHKDHLLQHGEKKRDDADGSLTIKSLADHFLTAKKQRLDSEELSPRTYPGILRHPPIPCRHPR